MVEKLSVTIALEGGKEIERQLADIGEAGKKAFADIGQAAEKAGGFRELKPDEVKAKLKDLGITGVDALNKIQAAVKSASQLETVVQGVAAVESGFKTLAAAAGPVVAGIVAGFVEATKLALAWADSINKISNEAMKLGVGVEQLDQLRRGFGKAGISAEAVADGLRHVKSELDKFDVERVTLAFNQLQEAATRGFGAGGTDQLKLLSEAAQGTGAAADKAREALQKLGATNIPLDPLTEQLNKLGLAGQTLPERISSAITALGKMPDTAQRTALAFKFLGDKLGAEFILALRTGSAALIDFQSTASGVTQEQAIEAARTQQTLNQLTAQWDSFKADILAPIAMPTLAFLRSELTGLQTGIRTTIDEFAKLGAFLVSLTNLGPTSFWNSLGEAIVRAAGNVGDFISSIAGITWDTVSSNGVAAWNAVTGAVSGSYDAVVNFASSLATIVWDSISSVGVAAWDAITGAINKAIGAIGDAIKAVKQLLGLGPSGGTSGGSDAPGKASGGLIGGRGTGTSDSNLAWVSRGEYVMPARVVRQPGMLAFLEGLRGGGAKGSRGGLPAFADGGSVGMVRATSIDQIVQAINSLASSIGQAFDKVAEMLERVAKEDTVTRGFDGVKEDFKFLGKLMEDLSKLINESTDELLKAIGGLADSIKEMASNAKVSTQKTGELAEKIVANQSAFARGIEGREIVGKDITPKSFAGGGLLGGRGSGTSDSNLAWVSRGEHIMPARAVSQPGVLAFLEALRRSGGNLSRVLDGMGRFALGGLVSMPAFAGGGVGGMSHVTIQFPGLPAIGGLRAPGDVVEQLQRAAAMAQVRSGGRKPSRYS